MSHCRSKLGSKREVRPGVWQVRVSQGYRHDGAQRVATRTVHGTEADAIATIVELSQEMGRCLSTGDPMTLDTYFYGYFLPLKQKTTSNANWKTYRHHFRAHISPHFGKWPLSRIGNVEIQRWINQLPPQSAPNYARTLRAILNQAHFDHLKDDQPMGEGYRYRYPKGRRTAPGDVWGADEVAECMSRLAGDQLFPLWLVMVGCGLSRSEALALDWEDLKWAETVGMDGQPHMTCVVTVERAVTAEDGVKGPKNDRRYRRVPMRPPFSDALWHEMDTGPICQSYRSAKGGPRPSGHRLSPGYVPKKWKELFDEGGPLFGMPYCPIGRMRATYSTLMQQAGVDRTIINAMQGRSDDSPVLYKHYLNPGNDTFRESADTMARLVNA